MQGNCSDSILRQIYEATMNMRIVYLRVDTPYEGVEALPLKAADETWTGGARAPQQGKRGLDSMSERIYLPLLRSYRLRPERPLGFFDASSGRMLGYLAP